MFSNLIYECMVELVEDDEVSQMSHAAKQLSRKASKASKEVHSYDRPNSEDDISDHVAGHDDAHKAHSAAHAAHDDVVHHLEKGGKMTGARDKLHTYHYNARMHHIDHIHHHKSQKADAKRDQSYAADFADMSDHQRRRHHQTFEPHYNHTSRVHD